VPQDQPDLVIRARRVLTPAGIVPAEVYVHAGRILAVTRWAVRTTLPGGPRSVGTLGSVARATSPSLGLTFKTIELRDDEILMPGLVDTHVHVNEPGRTEWEGFATATAAAAAGGVTTIIDMPLNSIPPTIDIAALEVKRKAAASQSFVDVGFWAGAVPGNENDYPDLHAAGTFGFKCFMVDSGVPEFPPLDNDDLAAAMQRVAKLDSMLIVHAEDASSIGYARPASGAEYAAFLKSRPAAAEVAAISRVIKLAGMTGARVHVLHLSAADAVPLIEAARSTGVQISAETCPHYLALSAEQVGPGQTQFKCCPPIRDTANQDRLWEALRAGVIGCVVSDHSPCPPELKDLDSGDFGKAWGGISSVQLSLPVVWTKARERGFGLTHVARWMAESTARLVGLPQKGAIEVGRDADLIAFAPDEKFVVDPDRLLTRHRLTPYAGQELSGVVRRTWLRGVPVGTEQPAGEQLSAGGGRVPWTSPR
jgi:allantoinase